MSGPVVDPTCMPHARCRCRTLQSASLCGQLREAKPEKEELGPRLGALESGLEQQATKQAAQVASLAKDAEGLRFQLSEAQQAQHAAEQETVAAQQAQRQAEERAQQERQAWEQKLEAAQQAAAAAAATLEQEREQRAAAQALAERRGGEAEAVLQMLACARAAVPPAPAPASCP
ncbi:hypothetical protein ABPG75_003638 [Micractinium tetrahymenae]